jgi:hypothetical protein
MVEEIILATTSKQAEDDTLNIVTFLSDYRRVLD